MITLVGPSTAPILQGSKVSQLYFQNVLYCWS